MAYGGEDEIVDRHWPTWERAECDIWLSFPVDDPCRRGGLAFNKSQHHGSEVMARIFKTYEFMLKTNYETFYMIEYDSICLRKAPRKLPGGLHAFLWNNGGGEFKATQYPHYAHGMNRATLTKLSLMAKRFDPCIEQGFQDRAIGFICEQTAIPMIHRPDLCHSRNRIDTPEYIEQAKAAIASGVTFVHGCKTEQDLRNIGQ